MWRDVFFPASLFPKLAATMALVLAAAVSLSAWLNLLRFESTQTDMIQQRLTVALEDARRDILVGLDLGLTPENMETLPETLSRGMGVVAGTRSVRVLDCSGTPVATAGAPPPATSPWAAHLAEDRWMAFGEGVMAGGLKLVDNLGDCAGVLVIELDDAPRLAALADMHDRLWRTAALALLALVPGVGLVALILRRRKSMVAHLSADLEAALAGSAATASAAGSASVSTAAPAPPPVDPREALTSNERRMIDAWRAARDALTSEPEQRP